MPEFDYDTSMDDDIIDETALNGLRDAIGEKAMEDFLDRFFEDCKARTDRIANAYDKSRFSEVELEAHTLGSSAATYGALKLEKLCREIEFAKPGKSKAFQDRIDQLNILSEKSLKALRDYTS